MSPKSNDKCPCKGIKEASTKPKPCEDRGGVWSEGRGAKECSNPSDLGEKHAGGSLREPPGGTKPADS